MLAREGVYLSSKLFLLMLIKTILLVMLPLNFGKSKETDSFLDLINTFIKLRINFFRSSNNVFLFSGDKL